ncbi:DUF4012 domain-containing protein [Cellulomonas bogoriensis]|uniref:Peptide synthetase n=1 Tax=Cellulomonas bogoriensis 69B4 = DSM 16987 TaxID=1386082 RepID=A0A0A0BMY0_9CELL|nr:DUF4012 domain-containing protein [Cellulomonas bogoriensis]KGM09306.1 peptide synthetase [Cellulomonas bogoriensis 69B4 = DSM 16987]
MTAPEPAGHPLLGHEYEGAPSHRRGALRTWSWRVAIILTGVLIVWAAWLGWRVSQVVQAMQGVAPVALQGTGTELGALAAGDVTRAPLPAGDIGSRAPAYAVGPGAAEAAARAYAATQDPVWRLSERLPWIGDQLQAVGEVVEAFGVVVGEALPALVEVEEVVQGLSLEDGRVELAPVAASAPHLERAAASTGAAHALVQGVDTATLVAPLATQVDRAEGLLGEAAQVLDGAHRVATLVPAMLGHGQDEVRRYLVLAINPAELRAGGGIVGAVMVLEARDGRLDLVDHRPATDLPILTAPVLPLDDEEAAVHGDRLARVLQNVTMTPDFPRSAELAATMWHAAGGRAVDGVLALDPVALSHVLRATGPVTLEDGTVLDAGGVVEHLLLDTYVDLTDPSEADEHFARAASAVFDAVARGGAGLVGAVGEAAGERRVAVWSAHPAEQALLSGSAMAGDFLSGGAPTAPGLFLEDATGGKLATFLDTRVDAACGSGGVQVTLRLASTLAPELARVLPPYVVGFGVTGVEPGTARHNVLVYAPEGAHVQRVERDGIAVGVQHVHVRGRDVVRLTSVLPPGADEEWTVTLGGLEAVPTQVWTTPTPSSPGLVPVRCAVHPQV